MSPGVTMNEIASITDSGNATDRKATRRSSAALGSRPPSTDIPELIAPLYIAAPTTRRIHFRWRDATLAA